MKTDYVNKLPNELLLQVFADFDSEPPSVAKFSLQPSPDLTEAANAPLKGLSLVCKRWRDLVLSDLFRYARVTLDRRAAWLRLCPGLKTKLYIRRHCPVTPLTRSIINRIELHDLKLGIDEKPIAFDYIPLLAFESHQQPLLPDMADSAIQDPEYHIYQRYFHWLPSVHGQVENFLNFLTLKDLCGYVKSLVIFSHNGLQEQRSNLEEILIMKETKILWNKIFTTINLHQMIVAAPPSTMAELVSSNDGAWDSWLFEMPYHYLKFSIPDMHQIQAPSLPSSPSGGSRMTFLYNVRPWTQVSYNEGTAIKGYGHYEYQWRQLPLVLPNLIDWLSREPHNRVESLEYISLFPYASHLVQILDPLKKLKHLQNLRVKLADPELLNAPEILGRAQPSDVWQEWETCYRKIPKFLREAKVGTVFSTLDTEYPNLKDLFMKSIQQQWDWSSVLKKEDDPIKYIRL